VEVSTVDLLAFFRESVLAPPHPNPEGGIEWFHGTTGHFDDPDTGDEDRYSPPTHQHMPQDEYFQNSNHWNTDLGTHWTSERETAEFFAKGQSHGQPHETSRVAHATLHMANPKHYRTEFDLSGDATQWAKNNGFRHLPSEQRDHDHFINGQTDMMSGATRSGLGSREHVDYEGHPYHSSRDVRESISQIDRDTNSMTGKELADRHGSKLDAYLGAHPFRDEIVEGFKNHLRSQGHDGVTYGNMYEEPRGHTCAVPFDDDQVNLKRWSYLKPGSKYRDVNRDEPEQVEGQQPLVSPDWTPGKGHHWKTHDGREAAKVANRSPETDQILRMLGVDPERHHNPGRSHTLAEQGGEARLLPTPSAMNPEPKGFRPGDDLAGMDKHPHVGWVKTDALIRHREYDRADPSQGYSNSREKIDSIKREFQDHGQREPVVLIHDPDTDKAYLGEGNHRLAAAHELGWPALAVHVTRAYAHEAETKMNHPRFSLGSHKVHPDEYGYTPGSLRPRDALPDHYLYDGESKTAVHWSEPRPDYSQGDDYDVNRNRRNDWTHEVRKALSRGDLTGEQAISQGYTGKGHDQHPARNELTWQKMPDRLYHVTTDLKGVLANGLKSRKELAQNHGKGLGGGDDDTISFTEDHHLAGHILDSLREFHDVANGKKTPQDMYDEAKAGTGASRPFHEDMLIGMHPHEVHSLLRGKVVHQTYATQAQMDARGDGKWEPHPGSQPLNGTHDILWHRDATDDEKLDQAVRLYKRFSFMRAHAGGRPDPMFFSTDVKGFAAMDPKNFGIVHAKPKPGAQGYRMGSMSEWRTADGSAVDINHHRTTAAKSNPLDGYDVHHFFEERHGAWGHHTLFVEHDDDHVGHLTWTTSKENKRPPTIEGVWVRDDHQRKGVATELLRRAREITPGLKHSDELSQEGSAWAEKVGSLIARWLPHDRIFGPGKGGLDPRLFNKKKIMKPEVAAVILGDLDAYWAPTYPDWRDWTRVYLAGSEASEWYGNNDFDTLLGIDHARLRKSHPEFDGMTDDDIDAYLTTGLRENLNNEDWIAPWDGQVWHRTYYVNPNSWEIRDIKPYAAYDITRKKWAVEPFHPTADWGPEKLPSSFWDEAESIVKQVKAIEKMPDPYRTGRGAALFDMLHSDRRRAFGPNGTGVYDPGNAVWKYLDMHGDHPLAMLVDLKRKYESEKVPV
jgi:GNAT superfamily N-acetyltransferase